MPGGSVNLTCVAVGAPMPYVKWISGEVELTREVEMPIGRNVLELTNIRQSANYTCVAISSLGMIETTAQIIVKGQKSLFFLSLYIDRMLNVIVKEVKDLPIQINLDFFIFFRGSGVLFGYAVIYSDHLLEIVF